MAAGLKNPSNSVKTVRKNQTIMGEALGRLIAETAISAPLDSRARSLRYTTVLITEAEAYAMILTTG